MNNKDDLLFCTSIMRDHAHFQVDALAPKEQAFIEKSMYFVELFKQLNQEIKASEFQTMMAYTGLVDGNLTQPSQEAIQMMTDIICFFENIKELRQACRLMATGTFSPLVPDHFIREHQHWIGKIKEFTK